MKPAAANLKGRGKASRPAAACLAALLVAAGCVTYEEPRTTPADPHAPVRQMVRAASVYHAENEGWPGTPEELEAFAASRPESFTREAFHELEFSPAPDGMLEVHWATVPPAALEGRLTLRPPPLPEEENAP